MKGKLVTFIIIGLLALAASIVAYNLLPIYQTARDSVYLENALARKNLFLWAEADVDQLLLLEHWYMGTPILELPGKKGQKGLAGQLVEAGLDPRHNLSRLHYALYVEGKEGVQQAYLLGGKFPSEQINGYLRDRMKAKPITISRMNGWEVAVTDPKTCKATKTWNILVDSQWILIADPLPASTISEALKNSSEPEIDLSEIHELSKPDPLTAALFVPNAASDTFKQSLVGKMSEKAVSQLKGIHWTYIGAGAKFLPPGAQLRFVMEEETSGASADRAREWQKTIDESKEQWRNRVPSIATLHDRLQVSTTSSTQGHAGRITATTTFNRAFLKDATKVPAEVLSLIFPLHISNTKTANTSESLLQTPQQYLPVANDSAIPGYNPEKTFGDKVEKTSGPFGARIESLAIVPDSKKGAPNTEYPELQVFAFGQGLPNVPKDSKNHIFLKIDQVLTSSGQDVLAQESCNSDSKIEPAPFQSSFTDIWKSEKKIQLIQGTDLAALRTVTGKVELHLPIRTQTIELDGSANRRAKVGDTTLSVTEISGGQVSYQIIGPSDSILEVRGLNAEGKPLSQQSSMSSDFLFGEGTSVSREFQGKVSKVQVIASLEDKKLTYPFRLEDFSLRSFSLGFAMGSVPTIRPYTFDQMEKEFSHMAGRKRTWTPSPFPHDPTKEKAWANVEACEIVLTQLWASGGITLALDLRCPNAEGLRQAVYAGRMRIDRIKLKNGTFVTPENKAPSAESEEKSFFAERANEVVQFSPDSKTQWLQAQLNFRLNGKIAADQVSSIQGVLELRFPRSIDQAKISDLGVGKSFALSDKDASLSGRVIRRSRSQIKLQVAPVHSLIAAQAFDSQGRWINAFQAKIESQTSIPNGSIELSPLGEYSEIRLYYSPSIETRQWSFELVLPK